MTPEKANAGIAGRSRSSSRPSLSDGSDSSDPDLRSARRTAWWLDEAIPLPGGFRIGFDGLLGLIPGIGDAAGGVIGSYILLQAHRRGVPSVVIARMVGNLVLEMVIGIIPILGDLFDFAFKANRRNVALMERYFVERAATKRRSGIVVLLGLLLVISVIVIVSVLAFQLLVLVWTSLFAGTAPTANAIACIATVRRVSARIGQRASATRGQPARPAAGDGPDPRTRPAQVHAIAHRPAPGRQPRRYKYRLS